MRKEATAAYSRHRYRRQDRGQAPTHRSVLRSSLKLIGLVAILSISAYLLLVPERAQIQVVNARHDVSAPPRPDSQPPSVVQERINPVAALSAVNPASAVSSLEMLAGIPATLEQASPQQKTTADHLMQFISTGDMAEIRDMPTEDVQSLLELFVNELGTDALAAAAESYLGLPASEFLAQENPVSNLTDLFEAVRTTSGPTNVAPVVFSDQVEADGRVTGNVHVIPAGTHRVYAAFENAGALQGLERVLAVWRNPSSDRMMFTEYEPIRKGSVYNYVWLELEDGWPTGFYQLDLYHPSRTSERLASRSFNVR